MHRDSKRGGTNWILRRSLGRIPERFFVFDGVGNGNLLLRGENRLCIVTK